MKKIFKRAIMAVTALAVMLTAVVFDMPAKTVARAATGGCDGTHSGMSAWTNKDYLPTSGNYYLDTDVNLSLCIITGDLTLCLNGHTVTAASGKQIFSISNSLTLCDCSSGKTGKLIGGGNVSVTGGAVDVNSSGTFTMNGGTISGNTAGTGGGVFVRSGASFIMNGGTISNNITKSSGGGVYSSGIFTMNGGTISDNTTNSNAGGGVFVSSDGTFIMNGGMISSNTADIRGGGVYVNGTFTMSGGTISGNTVRDGTDLGGGGVLVSNGQFIIDGKVEITGNTLSGSDNNVRLNTNKTITIGNDFDPDSKIGVNTTAPTCTTFADVTGATTEEISASFTADINGQSIVYEDGKVQLKGAHTFSSPTTIDPTCTEPGGETGICTVCNEDTFNPTTPATGHAYGAWSITTDPTESAEGTAERVCNNDGTHKETKTDVPALNDSTVWTKTSQDDNDVYTSEYGTVEVAKIGGNGDSGNSGNSGNTGNTDNSNNSGDNTNNSDDNSTPVNATNEVRQDENVPKTELATPTEELIGAVLTPEEQAQLKDGDEVKFVLQVGDTVSDEDKQLAESSLEADEGLKIAQYMDISLIKEINGNRTKVTKTNEPIKLTFEVPEALRGSARTFEVLRVYDGEATLLSDLDDDENTVTIETDILAVYVLVYRERSSAPESGNPATGIAVSLVPIAAALAFATAAVVRKKK